MVALTVAKTGSSKMIPAAMSRLLGAIARCEVFTLAQRSELFEHTRTLIQNVRMPPAIVETLSAAAASLKADRKTPEPRSAPLQAFLQSPSPSPAVPHAMQPRALHWETPPDHLTLSPPAIMRHPMMPAYYGSPVPMAPAFTATAIPLHAAAAVPHHRHMHGVDFNGQTNAPSDLGYPLPLQASLGPPIAPPHAFANATSLEALKHSYAGSGGDFDALVFAVAAAMHRAPPSPQPLHASPAYHHHHPASNMPEHLQYSHLQGPQHPPSSQPFPGAYSGPFYHQ